MATADHAGAILAAGRGARLAPLSKARPKPLFPVLGDSILVHQLESFAAVGVEDVYVVVSELGDALREEARAHGPRDLRVHFVVQEGPAGIAHAVACLEPHVDRPFVLVLGDIACPGADLSPLLEAHRRGTHRAVLGVRPVARAEAIRPNYAVELEGDRVARVEEKPERSAARLKGLGLYVFEPAFFDAVRRTPRTPLRGERELTDAIQIFIDDGASVGVAPLDLQDTNVNGPEDLLQANLLELSRRGLPRWISPGADVPEPAAVDRSVICAGARVVPGVRVIESVLLPGAVANEDVTRAIVDGDHRIDVPRTGTDG